MKKWIAFLCVCCLPALARAEAPRTKSLACKVSGKRSVVLSGSDQTFELSQRQLAANPLVVCTQINWQNETFLSVQYTTKQQASYSGKVQSERYNEVFRLADGGARSEFTDLVDSLKAVWMEVHGSLVLRDQDKDEDGKPLFENGYVYVDGQFVDFAEYAIEHGWSVD